MKSSTKKVIAAIILVCGIVLYGSANYITKQVAIGRGEIAAYQAQVDRTNNLIDNSTHLNGMGEVITGSAQQKLNAGNAKANYYAHLAANLKTGGIVLIVISVIYFLFRLFTEKKRSDK